ncbi:MAG: ATP-dependent helicase [Chloroflexi bacterium]|nr:ATP-dependent helicase [Chloroflexota bacterium]
MNPEDEATTSEREGTSPSPTKTAPHATSREATDNREPGQTGGHKAPPLRSPVNTDCDGMAERAGCPRNGFSTSTLLNPDQLAAVRHTGGALRIVAGPGTGKTMVIVERIAHLIETGRAKPENILALTFSRKAAEETRNRVALRLQISYSSLAVSTFHGFCFGVVRDHFQDLGYKNPPELLVATEQWVLVKDLLKSQLPELWPHYRDVLGKDGFVQEVFDFILRAQENLHTPSTLRQETNREDWPEIIDFYAYYLDHVRSHGFIDYGGVIARTVDLLEEGSAALAELRERFRYILVDEYQDTNYAQDQIVFRLQQGRGNICVVGDDDQSIHGFRGATVENILSFDQRYGAETIELRTNYRSCRGIVETARSVIERNAYRLAKNLISAGEGNDPIEKPVECRFFPHYADEANWIAGKIIELAGPEQRYNQVAVLFRSVKGPLAGLIRDELQAAGVPVRLSGGTGELYNHPLVRTVLDLMAFLAAEEVDSAGLVRLLQSDLCGAGPFAIRLLQREAARARKSLYEYLQGELEDSAAGAADIEKAKTFTGHLAFLRERKLDSPAEVAFAIWTTIPYFAGLCLARYKNTAEEIARREALANISRFIEDVERFSGRQPETGVSAYLVMVEEGRFADVPLADPVDQLTNLVNIMTLHQAKGLEWDCVFLPGLSEGAFPGRYSPKEIADPVLLQRMEDAGQTREQRYYEEERRLFYVGLTRAKSRCYLSYSSTAAPSKDNSAPSRFFEEAAASPDAEKISEEPAEFVRPLNAREAEVFFRRGLAADDSLVRAQGVYGILALDGAMASQPKCWWENTETTDCPNSPCPSGRLYLSASQLALYRLCPLRYKFQYFWRLAATTSPQAERGRVMHAVLESYHNPEGPQEASEERLLKLLDQCWRDDAFPFRPIAKQARKKSEDQLRRYFLKYPYEDTLRVETQFTFPFQSHTMTGRIDRIDRLPEGELEIIDYKTSSSVMSRAEAEEDLQLAIYALAAESCPELSQLGVVSLVSYLYLGVESLGADWKRSYSPGEGIREALSGKLQRLSDGILDELFPPHSRIVETWGGQLDLKEMEWLKKNPCRTCEWTWLCTDGEEE